MAIFNPLNASLDQIFAILIQIIIRWELINSRILVDNLDLKERKVLEYLAHVDWRDHGISNYDRVSQEHHRALQYRQWLEDIQTRRQKIGNQVFEGEPYVPFRFFYPMKTSFVGPYGKRWSLQAVVASPLPELYWNKPFDSPPSIGYSLTETLPEDLIVHTRAFALSGGINRFFSRTPRDSIVRRDFTVRFLYEEEGYAMVEGERWPVLIYYTVFRRDVDFALDRIQYQAYLSSHCDPHKEKEPVRYVFGWERNIIESKIHHRFYRHYLNEEETKWVVKERGTKKNVRGRRGIVEKVVFEEWMGREEKTHKAWRQSEREFEESIAVWTDNEWTIDYEERISAAYHYWPSWDPKVGVSSIRLCGRADFANGRLQRFGIVDLYFDFFRGSSVRTATRDLHLEQVKRGTEALRGLENVFFLALALDSEYLDTVS
ncbi:hypothetical protein FB446DRAFT_707590 [Lentinula raphanica]|nr:hypothetical protein FB446DRAFT_707590 [Lentinula raphanica]